MYDLPGMAIGKCVVFIQQAFRDKLPSHADLGHTECTALQFLKWVTAKDSAPPPTHPFMSRGHILSQELSCHLRLRLGLRLSSYPVISLQRLGENLKARFASNLEPVCVYSQLFLLPLSGSFSSLVKKTKQNPSL